MHQRKYTKLRRVENEILIFFFFYLREILKFHLYILSTFPESYEQNCTYIVLFIDLREFVYFHFLLNY